MPGPLTLAEIASRLGGRVRGEPATRVLQVGSLEAAGPEHITFLVGSRNRARLAATRAGAVILRPEMEPLTALPAIVCDDPYAYFARVSQLFNPVVAQPVGVHPAASFAPSARLGARVSIGAGCVVGENVTIGDDSCLYPNVVV
jgi:UDP-3-O-[3-hydroxymyristoyl] glucosamine N-acyltransferase